MFRRRNRKAPEPEPQPEQKALAVEALPDPKPAAPPVSKKASEPPKTEKKNVALLRKEDVDQPSARAGGTGALLGRGTRFEGKLTFEGTVEIEGEFVGDIVSKGHLKVGKDAKVEGTIAVKSAVISGQVGGTITTSGPLELRSTARVHGDLNVETLVVEKGAWFGGTVQMRKAGQPGPAPRGVTNEAPPVVAPPKVT